MSPRWTEFFCGSRARLRYLIFAAMILLLAMLGSREIWTQEHRWADIVFNMFYSHDFFHPSLDGNDYYDKPLLSYWLIAIVAKVIGTLNVWALRLPSAFAGVLAVWSIYRLGLNLKDKRLGLLAGWMLLTTFYFVFWARTSSADMLNLAGSLFAVCWYFEKKSQPSVFDYAIFFVILAVTALCKGLVGPVVAVLAILPDLIMQKTWKRYLDWRLVLGVLPGMVIYVLPFWASVYFGTEHYQENGLYMVYRENILRYFQPFDHKDPIYTYFIYLPIYLLPWTLFFFPALYFLKSRWRDLSSSSRWMVWATFVLFIFFTLSGSRRSYYVLPIVPFAILMTADWIMTGAEYLSKRYLWAGRVAGLFYILLVINFCVLQPLYYLRGGVNEFATHLKHVVQQTKPWPQWHVVLLDPESKVSFYLQLSPQTRMYSVLGKRDQQTTASLLQAWPILKSSQTDIIFISRKMYEPLLRDILKNYIVVTVQPAWFKHDDRNAPIAFVPKAD